MMKIIITMGALFLFQSCASQKNKKNSWSKKVKEAREATSSHFR